MLLPHFEEMGSRAADTLRRYGVMPGMLGGGVAVPGLLGMQKDERY
jgi:hypothetical protein